MEVRKATGFGSSQIALIVNESLSQEGSTRRTTDTTCYNVLARNGLVEAGQGIQVVRMGPPGRAGPVRPDNDFPLLTMEDDHSRKGWATRLEDDAVVCGMKAIHPDKCENLLTEASSPGRTP